MGILSRLWSKNPGNESYIRRWLAQGREEDDREHGDVFVLFVELMKAASRFGTENSRFQATARQYLGDSTLFEITCYTYQRLEDWLAEHESGLRPLVAEPVADLIVEVFSVAWHKDEAWVNRQFAERLDGYRILAKNAEIEAIHGDLIQRILATRGDRLDGRSGPGDGSVPEDDRLFVEQSLALFETTELPAVLEAARDYCRRQTKQVGAEKKVLCGSELADQEDRDYRFAMALLGQRDFVKACRAFTKVLEANPDNYNALLERGRLQVGLGRPLEAVEDFSRAIGAKSDDWRAYLERGRCYQRVLRMGDEAAADYSKAIALEPDNPVGYFARGSLYDEIALKFEIEARDTKKSVKDDQAARGFRAAVDDYSKAIALNPEYDDAYTARGLAYARRARTGGNREDAARAVADLEKAIGLNWEHGYLYKTVDELKDLAGQAENSREMTTV